MDCQQVREQLSEYLDGRVLDRERSEISLHLNQCEGCGAEFNQIRQISFSLRALPRRAMTHAASVQLRIEASIAAEKRRFAGFAGRLRRAGRELSLWSDNLMKPVVGPAAGGIAAAILLFCAVMVNFQDIVVAQAPNDVRTMLYTDASVKSTPLSYEFDEVVLDVFVDEQGRVIDYSFPQGYGALKTSALRRKMEHSLLFAQFTPATAFGQPTSGWVRISFRRSEIDVKG